MNKLLFLPFVLLSFLPPAEAFTSPPRFLPLQPLHATKDKRPNIGDVFQHTFSYANKLWNDTSVDSRKLIAKQRASKTIEDAQKILLEKKSMGDLVNTTIVEESPTIDDVSLEHTDITTEKKKKKKGRSILFGASIGASAALWVFSGDYIFTALFTLVAALAQLEYYKLVMNAGIFPARRITVVGGCTMFITALFAPQFHQICLPLFTTGAMMWFLGMRREISTIADVATTFTGLTYLGYIPSFWIRVRSLNSAHVPTLLAPILSPLLRLLGRKSSTLPNFLPKSVHLPISTGSVFLFWTWLCVAFSDVGAYFVGRRFGKTKLGAIAPAAGVTSPNKTVEGFVGGCAFSMILGVFGAWVMKWPWWGATGALHGLLLAVLGLVGDLTASMLKRDSGMKDFGDLIPEHGGIMDRVDSYVFAAPYCWVVCKYIIPALRGSPILS